jgi:hypothetical protein
MEGYIYQRIDIRRGTDGWKGFTKNAVVMVLVAIFIIIGQCIQEFIRGDIQTRTR